jgi:uncharacterized protein YgbK (DUF1537 family)
VTAAAPPGSPATLLGCIADDLTGATDVALMLQKAGMRTVLTIGVPAAPVPVRAEAVVVALKSRTAPVAEAVGDSLTALGWLRERGAGQILFKYCSTFDSTDAGNIGPVADALLDALGEPFTVACPAFPTNRRTVYLGHLFVGDVLLSDSPMKDHPLTPMRDANLVRVLGRQTRRRVGLVPHATVRDGGAAIGAACARLREEGYGYAIVDAVADEDLLALGEAAAGLGLVTGGSGIAMGLPRNFVRAGRLEPRTGSALLDAVGGGAAVVAGSCSEATRRQVATMAARHAAIAVDPRDGTDADRLAARALDRAAGALAEGRPVLVYSSAEPAEVRAVQAQLGRERAGAIVEGALARVAVGLVEQGVRRLVVAGGETAGAVVHALGVTALTIGPEIDPGVPWTRSIGERPLLLALKSGNFGGPDFFERALAMAR